MGRRGKCVWKVPTVWKFPRLLMVNVIMEVHKTKWLRPEMKFYSNDMGTRHVTTTPTTEQYIMDCLTGSSGHTGLYCTGVD
jgi:hypothetical protein